MTHELMEFAVRNFEAGKHVTDYCYDQAQKKMECVPIEGMPKDFKQPTFVDRANKFVIRFNMSGLGLGYDMYDFDNAKTLKNYWYLKPGENKVDSATNQPSPLTDKDAKLVRLSYGCNFGPDPLFLDTLALLRNGDQPLDLTVKTILEKEVSYLVQIDPNSTYSLANQSEGYVLLDDKKNRHLFMRTVRHLQDNDVVHTTSLIMIDLNTNHYFNANTALGLKNVKCTSDPEDSKGIKQQWNLQTKATPV